MTLQILENIVVFILDIRLWSGRKKLCPEDLAANGIDPEKLPPGTLASLGSKRIIGAEALAPFASLKREAEKICLARGVRFLGGYAVPVAEAKQVHRRLEELKLRFETARAELLTNYNQALEQWIAENPPQWAPIIRASAEPAAHVQKAFGFGFTPLQVGASEELAGSKELDTQTEGLLGQLCHEIRAAAQSAYGSSYRGRSSVTRKALRPIQAIREKLAGLCFLGPIVTQALAQIDQSLDQVPQTGPIEGASLEELADLLGRQLANLGCPEPEEEPDCRSDASDQEKAQDRQLQLHPLPVPARRPALALSWDF